MRDICKTFHLRQETLTVLQDINCSAGVGEFVSIVGPSGCGKSTLLKIAAGLMEPDHGLVVLAGRNARPGRRDVGILLQNPALLPWRTVLNNVLMPFVMFGEADEAARRRAIDVLQMVGLQDFTGAYPWQLSGGMQQRTALARLFAYSPDILLMDEPFGALDELTRERLNIELCRIHEFGHETVLFVTHGIQEAVLLSDRVLVMGPGQIVGDITIGLPRPRDISMVDDSSFIDTARHIRDLLGIWKR